MRKIYLLTSGICILTFIASAIAAFVGAGMLGYPGTLDRGAYWLVGGICSAIFFGILAAILPDGSGRAR